MSIERTILATTPIPSLPGHELRTILLTYPPGVSAPLHDHPVAATGYVVQGHVISQWEGSDVVETYSAGQAFVDQGGAKHVLSRNASETEELKMVMSYVIKVGVPNVRML